MHLLGSIKSLYIRMRQDGESRLKAIFTVLKAIMKLIIYETKITFKALRSEAKRMGVKYNFKQKLKRKHKHEDII